MIKGEKRVKSYKIRAENGKHLIISEVECAVYEKNKNRIVIDNLKTEIIDNGSSSVIVTYLFDTTKGCIEENKSYLARLKVTIGEEIYIKDQLFSISD